MNSRSSLLNGVSSSPQPASSTRLDGFGATRRIRAAVAAMIRQPLYYTVKRGDALSLIARKFDATPEQIQQWNNLEGNLIKIGQRLLVKPEKK